MKLSIKLISLVLAFAMLVSGVCLATFAAMIDDGEGSTTVIDAEGYLNADESIKWEYYETDSLLKIIFRNKGGAAGRVIPDYVAAGSEEGTVAPWKTENVTKIETLDVGDGITVIGSYTFDNLTDLTKVILPASLTEIKEFAFAGSEAITELRFGGTKEQWEAITIADNNGLIETSADNMVAAGIDVYFGGVKYEPTTGVTAGDVDLNGSVEEADAHLLASYIAKTYVGAEFSADQLTAADVNSDGEYTVVDVVSILKLASQPK